MKEETKMSEEFYNWLNECPVQWVREKVINEGLIYFFSFPEED